MGSPGPFDDEESDIQVDSSLSIDLTSLLAQAGLNSITSNKSKNSNSIFSLLRPRKTVRDPELEQAREQAHEHKHVKKQQTHHPQHSHNTTPNIDYAMQRYQQRRSNTQHATPPNTEDASSNDKDIANLLLHEVTSLAL